MQWDNFYLGLLAGFVANWIFVILSRIIPSKWIRYNVQIEGVGQLDTGLGNKDLVAHIRIMHPKFKRILRDPLSEYVITLICLDRNTKTCGRAIWVDGDERKTQALVNGATTINALLCEVTHYNNVYFSDNFPDNRLDYGEHIISIVIRWTADSLDACTTDVIFNVSDTGIEVIEYKPISYGF